MAIGQLTISHQNFNFDTLDSKWLTKKNINKVINSSKFEDYHTSLSDCGVKMGNIEQGLLEHCQSIKCLDLSWDIIINLENHENYSQLVYLLSTKFKGIAAGTEELYRSLIAHSTYNRATRTTNDPVLWVAGCSFSSAIGVEPNERWGHLIAEELKLEEVNVAIGGGSIWDANDQLLRADIRKGDIVIWGLTSSGRVDIIDKNRLQSFTIRDAVDIEKCRDYYNLDYFFSNTQNMLLLREIEQIINYCEKIGANLYLVNFLDRSWIPLMLRDRKNFLDLQKPIDDHSCMADLIDYGSDGEHPGPAQHQDYAKEILNFTQGANNG